VLDPPTEFPSQVVYSAIRKAFPNNAEQYWGYEEEIED